MTTELPQHIANTCAPLSLGLSKKKKQKHNIMANDKNQKGNETAARGLTIFPIQSDIKKNNKKKLKYTKQYNTVQCRSYSDKKKVSLYTVCMIEER
jgi:hypothetical protein